ncbi:hypothetical protein SFRURICE_007537 [Spodoptera frugiperda]|nr:hypothetical protein SFRURICE_007537 [Spodoptera frugiperda]
MSGDTVGLEFDGYGGSGSKSRYRNGILLPDNKICSLAKQLDMTERQVERWWRLRRSQDKPSTLVKFCENMWRFTFYLYNFSYGVFILWEKEWLWDIDQCYIGYPHQGLTNDIWWYYMISAAFYWALTFSQFWDVRRKDFWQMFVHHIATILLLSFSWVCNLHRIGTLVLLVHDCADIFLDAAKAAKYANYQRLCDTIFAGFTVLWIVSRLFVYPFYIIWSTSIRAPMLLPMFPAYYIFNSLLCLLLGLHMVWTWLILQVAYKAISAGQRPQTRIARIPRIPPSSYATDFSLTCIKIIQLRPLIRIVRTAHRCRQCLHAMRTDDVIRNANAKNSSESGIGNPIADTRVGIPIAVETSLTANRKLLKANPPLTSVTGDHHGVQCVKFYIISASSVGRRLLLNKSFPLSRVAIKPAPDKLCYAIF